MFVKQAYSPTNTSLLQILSHSLKHSHNGLLNTRNLHTKSSASLHQLARIQLVIRSSCSKDLRLFLQCKVGISKLGINVLLVQIQNLVVRNHSRIGEVVHTLHFNKFASDPHGSHEESSQYWQEGDHEELSWS